MAPRALVVASLGSRPWASLTVARQAAYAKKLNADLLFVGAGCRRHTDRWAFDVCAKRHKLVALRGALDAYARAKTFTQDVSLSDWWSPPEFNFMDYPPDGMALDADGGLLVCHAGNGTVWHFDHMGEPKHRIRSCRGLNTTNIAFGGNGNRSVFITESMSGSILRAELPVAGKTMYSHLS